jgi:hypothetical protein
MGSSQHLLRTFAGCIEERAAALQGAYEKKLKFDALLRTRHGPNDSLLDVQALKHIIGEDQLFRKAERRDEQTLRHLLYKLVVGMDWMTKEIPRILRSLSSEPGLQAVAIELQRTLALTEQLLTLDKLFAQEAALLSEMKVTEYLATSEKELAIVQSIQSFAARIEACQKELGGLLLSLRNGAAKMTAGVPQQLFNLFFTFTLAAILLGGSLAPFRGKGMLEKPLEAACSSLAAVCHAAAPGELRGFFSETL